VIVLTPDDLGGAKADVKEMGDLKTRARQNVIFEAGVFVGRLSRARVCCLRKGNVEMWSDYSGIVWIDMDDRGAWKSALLKEMEKAGLPIDWSKF
jgi:predicted nucleotide-binding protein